MFVQCTHKHFFGVVGYCNIGNDILATYFVCTWGGRNDHINKAYAGNGIFSAERQKYTNWSQWPRELNNFLFSYGSDSEK